MRTTKARGHQGNAAKPGVQAGLGNDRVLTLLRDVSMAPGAHQSAEKGGEIAKLPGFTQG